MKRPNLYLDLDGVFADFDKKYQELFNKNCADEDDAVLWQNIDAYREFFAELELFEGGIEFFNALRKYNPIILSACPRSDYQNAAILKRAWVRKNMCEEMVILTVLGGKNKPLFMHSKGDILLDDMSKNIDAWNEFGGVGILHKGDYAESLKEIQKYFD